MSGALVFILGYPTAPYKLSYYYIIIIIIIMARKSVTFHLVTRGVQLAKNDFGSVCNKQRFSVRFQFYKLTAVLVFFRFGFFALCN